MINHHPSIERLSAFAAGALPLSQALCISAHTEQCAHCRRLLRRLELVGSEMLRREPARELPAENDGDLKQRLLARLDELEADAAAPGPLGQLAAPRTDLPRCLQSLLPNGLEAVAWKRLSPSIQGAPLCTDVNGAKVELLKIRPGGQVASHNHTGEEITLVLQGCFSDASGIYRRGDIIFRDREHRHHQPIASQDAECICLTSVEAPIQFTGLFARLLNPMIRRSHYSS